MSSIINDVDEWLTSGRKGSDERPLASKSFFTARHLLVRIPSNEGNVMLVGKYKKRGHFRPRFFDCRQGTNRTGLDLRGTLSILVHKDR